MCVCVCAHAYVRECVRGVCIYERMNISVCVCGGGGGGSL